MYPPPVMPYIHLHTGRPHWAIQRRKGFLQCILICLQPLRCSCRRVGMTRGLPRVGNTLRLNQLDQCVPVLSLSIFDDLFTRQCARLWLPITRGVAAKRADFCFLCSHRLPHKPFSAHTLRVDRLSPTFECFLRVLLPSSVAPGLVFTTILAPAFSTAVCHTIAPVTPCLLVVLAARCAPRSLKTLALMHSPVVLPACLRAIPRSPAPLAWVCRRFLTTSCTRHIWQGVGVGGSGSLVFSLLLCRRTFATRAEHL